MRDDLRTWKNYRWIKLALLLGLLSAALYASQWLSPGQPPNGGTWQGYMLGTVGALLIAWLAMLGVRKRSYRSTSSTVQGWTSAHVYLGSMLLVVGTLHCAFQFGWNVHTLAYALMCGVIFSGVFGMYVYLHLPRMMSTNRAEKDRERWLDELDAVDEKIRDAVQRVDAELQALALSALELTRLGGSTLRQLSAIDGSRIQPSGGGKPIPNPEQRVILETLVQRIPDARKKAEAEVLNELLGLFGRRQVILHVLRKDVQLQGMVRIWLYVHIPLTVALLVALVAHILSVFIYW